MFLGTHHPRLDDKGRFFLPAKFRDELASGLVITKGQERCLYVFTAAEFASTAARWAAAPVTDKRGRDYLRVMYAGASDETPDKQGRITIPQSLRDFGMGCDLGRCSGRRGQAHRAAAARLLG